ncbi:MotA/TolQ/ExbB proton channel family protein [Pontiella agarivorans]|uniref:MotA/TolQ/ExbB proton channel family protein n=1 Tax=Pontiella agarivorans TaxID=3038953 RepID=A0ABU5MVC8_9BACT|nr:MotA/TolQ/ExbB proton channel family protein [Pontiella agarivorans]MDZ8118143.1 MotA/TolQ/ExbB proton channel family protein [Pontiella agarivorans]
MKREIGNWKPEAGSGKGLVFFAASWLALHAVAQDASGLLDKAKEKESAASEELAALRRDIQEEHAALQEKIRKAYAALEAAKTAASEAELERVRAEEEFKELKLRNSLASVKDQQLLRELLIAARVPVMPDQSWSEIHRALKQGIQDELDAMRERAALHRHEVELLDHAGKAATVPVLEIGAVQTVALGAGPLQRGLVERTPDGRAYLVGIAPENVGSGMIPIDVSGRLASAPPQKSFLQHYLSAGGIFLYPIIAVGLFGFVLVGERLVNTFRHRSPPELLDAVIGAARSSDWKKVHELVERQATPLQRVLHEGIQARGMASDKMEACIENAILEEVPRLERSMTMIAACAAIAPLLGLLGTVTGMIQTFKSLGLDAGGDALSQGISEALITTQVGLVVAVPLLLLHASFNRLIDRRVIRLEQAGHAMMAVIAEQSGGENQ